jgi:hypothetical protein
MAIESLADMLLQPEASEELTLWLADEFAQVWTLPGVV